MRGVQLQPGVAPQVQPRAWTLGCVSYLNAKPLIEGLDDTPGLGITLDVPSRLLERLERGEADVALCPVIDYHRSRVPLEILPVGGIGCRGATLTVRLYSRVPFGSITRVHADSDSHTSVALASVILAGQHRVGPEIVPLPMSPEDRIDSMLLIGDKVVTARPPAEQYPFQMDLGEAWRQMTGLPFVFAVWMTQAGSDLGQLPSILQSQRGRNAARIPQIVERYAAAHGWPTGLAQQYLSQNLCYEIAQPQLDAMRRFGSLAHGLGLIEQLQPLRLRW